METLWHDSEKKTWSFVVVLYWHLVLAAVISAVWAPAQVVWLNTDTVKTNKTVLLHKVNVKGHI